VKVTAFEVDHAPVKPAFGYRIDYAGHSVVLSGDTRINEKSDPAFPRVDLLVHEVFVPENLAARRRPSRARAKNIVAYHTTPEQAGQVFATGKAKTGGVFAYLPADCNRTGSVATDAQGATPAVGTWRGLMVFGSWREDRGRESLHALRLNSSA
jgi:hypothetical protein